MFNLEKAAKRFLIKLPSTSRMATLEVTACPHLIVFNSNIDLHVPDCSHQSLVLWGCCSVSHVMMFRKFKSEELGSQMLECRNTYYLIDHLFDPGLVHVPFI